MEPVQLTIDGDPSATGDGARAMVIRMPHEGDLPRLSEMFSDEAAVANTLVPMPWTAEHRDVYIGRCRKSWAEGSPRWVIADAVDDDVLGVIGLHAERFGAELVYQTAPWARRRRVALRACHKVLRFAFDELSVSRVSWGAITGNHLSRLVALRLGFTMEGVSRHGVIQRGKSVDVWAASLLPGELRDLSAPPAEYELWRRRALLFTGPQPRLDTEIPGLDLRPLAETDIDLLTETGTDPVTQEWTTVPRPYERRHSSEFVGKIAPSAWRLGTGAVFAITDTDDAYCGTIEIRIHTHDPREGDIGCVTAPWARGKGYMTAATKALCRFGFDSLGLERIEWHAHVGNEPSIRAATKAGFVAEGILRSGISFLGERRDLWQGAVLATDGDTKA